MESKQRNQERKRDQEGVGRGALETAIAGFRCYEKKNGKSEGGFNWTVETEISAQCYLFKE